MKAAVERRFELHTMTHQQAAHPQRAVEFVGGHRERRDAKLAEVDLDFAHRLHRIGVHRYAEFGAPLSQRPNRLQYAGLIIAEHDAHQRGQGVPAEEFFRVTEVELARGADSYLIDQIPFPAHLVGRGGDAGVLDRTDQQPAAWAAGKTAEGERVRLGAPAGENQLVRFHAPRLGAQQLGDPQARLLQHPPRQTAEFMLAGGVGVWAPLSRQHRLGDRFGYGGRRAVIEIDRLVHTPSIGPPPQIETPC